MSCLLGCSFRMASSLLPQGARKELLPVVRMQCERVDTFLQGDYFPLDRTASLGTAILAIFAVDPSCE